MKILYLGGNGNISWWCVKKSIELGYSVYVVNRGLTAKSRRSIPKEVHIINIDVQDLNALDDIANQYKFDVVCDFICFDIKDIRARREIFSNKVKQYIFVSSVVVYERKTSYLPFREGTPQWNTTDYAYATGKIEAEAYLRNLNIKDFPYTIVRPAHTYDTIVPVPIGHNCFTAPQRFLDGKPMLIPGDGTNLWSLCHSSDFADAFCELIGNEKAIGEDFHITGEEWLNWIDIGKEILSALGVPKAKLVHIPIKSILNLQIPKTSNLSITYLGENFRGQRMWCDIYDNSKIKKIAPGWRCQIKFYDGIRMTFEWLMADPGRMRFNKDLDLILERLTVENMNNIY